MASWIEVPSFLPDSRAGPKGRRDGLAIVIQPRQVQAFDPSGRHPRRPRSKNICLFQYDERFWSKQRRMWFGGNRLFGNAKKMLTKVAVAK
jgi:hypothetical protein